MELSFMEMVIIGIIAFVVLGPKELAKQAHRAGQFLGRVRREVDNFKNMTREELLREVHAEEIEKALRRAEIKKLEIEKHLNQNLEHTIAARINSSALTDVERTSEPRVLLPTGTSGSAQDNFSNKPTDPSDDEGRS